MMTDQKFGIFAAVQALRYAMLREGLSADGLTIILPEKEYDATADLLVRHFGGQMVYGQTPAQPGFLLMGVRIVSCADATIHV